MSNDPSNPNPIQISDTANSTPQSEPTTDRESLNTFSKTEIEEGRSMAVLVHILGIFTSFFGPLIIYAITVNPLVKMHAKNSLNFQISLIIYWSITFVLMLILIGFVAALGLSALGLILPIMATIKASDKITEDYRYPLSIPFLA